MEVSQRNEGYIWKQLEKLIHNTSEYNVAISPELDNVFSVIQENMPSRLSTGVHDDNGTLIYEADELILKKGNQTATATIVYDEQRQLFGIEAAINGAEIYMSFYRFLKEKHVESIVKR